MNPAVSHGVHFSNFCHPEHPAGASAAGVVFKESVVIPTPFPVALPRMPSGIGPLTGYDVFARCAVHRYLHFSGMLLHFSSVGLLKVRPFASAVGWTHTGNRATSKVGSRRPTPSIALMGNTIITRWVANCNETFAICKRISACADDLLTKKTITACKNVDEGGERDGNDLH